MSSMFGIDGSRIGFNMSMPNIDQGRNNIDWMRGIHFPNGNRRNELDEQLERARNDIHIYGTDAAEQVIPGTSSTNRTLEDKLDFKFSHNFNISRTYLSYHTPAEKLELNFPNILLNTTDTFSSNRELEENLNINFPYIRLNTDTSSSNHELEENLNINFPFNMDPNDTSFIISEEEEKLNLEFLNIMNSTDTSSTDSEEEAAEEEEEEENMNLEFLNIMDSTDTSSNNNEEEDEEAEADEESLDLDFPNVLDITGSTSDNDSFYESDFDENIFNGNSSYENSSEISSDDNRSIESISPVNSEYEQESGLGLSLFYMNDEENDDEDPVIAFNNFLVFF